MLSWACTSLSSTSAPLEMYRGGGRGKKNSFSAHPHLPPGTGCQWLQVNVCKERARAHRNRRSKPDAADLSL